MQTPRFDLDKQGLLEQLKLSIEHTLCKFQAPGAAVAIYINGQPFLGTGVGYQDIEGKIPLPTNANFYLYSITKSLLAIALLKLVDQGQLNLNMPIQSYLPHLPLDTPVTLQQLLSHTSGLPDYGGTSTYVNAVQSTPNTPWTAEAFLNLIQTQGLQFSPGRGWMYSNIGYLLLRCMLETITNLSLQAVLEEHIFRPLSLQNTFVPYTLSDVHGLTPGYSTYFSNDELEDVTAFYHPGWVAHGVVVSTASDLAQVMDALFAGKLLSPLLLKQMLDPVYILGAHPLFVRLGYALGLFVDVASPYERVGGHTGEGPGYSTAAFHFSSLAGYPVTLVAFANRDRHDLGLQLVFNMVHTLVEVC